MSLTVERLEAEISVNPARAIADLAAFDAALDRTAHDRTAHIDVDTERSSQRLHSFGTLMDDLNKELVNAGSAATTAGTALGGMGGAAGGAGNGLGSAGGAASSAGGSFLSMAASGIASVGMFALMAAAVAPAISLINALAGAAFALVAALAPLVGILGALPGLFLAAGAGVGVLFLALKPVISAIGLFTKAQTATARAGKSAAGSAREHAAALRNLQQATSQVARAQENLANAQKGIGDARKQAAKDLKNDRRDVESAVLSEEEAVLRLKRAQEALTKAQNATSGSTLAVIKQTDYFTGKVYETSRVASNATNTQADAAIALRQAQIDLSRAHERTATAKEKLNEAEKKGINNSDLVLSANRRVKDAQYSLATSLDGVAAAHDRLAKQQAGPGTTAMNHFNAAMKELTPAGREFVNFVTKELLPVFNGLSKAAQTAVLPGLQSGLRALLPMFGTLKGFVTEIGTVLGKNFAAVGKQLSTELGPHILELQHTSSFVLDHLLHGSRSILTIFTDVLVAAQPLVRFIAKGFDNAMTHMATFFNRISKDGTLTTFFKETQRVMGQVGHILGNLGKVFFAFLNAAAPAGQGLLDTFSKLTDKWAEWSGKVENQKTIQKWFHDAVDVAKELFGLFGDIVYQFVNIGGKGKPSIDGVKDALHKLREALPGIVTFLRQMGGILVDIIKYLPDIVRGIAGFIRGVQYAWVIFGPIFRQIKDDIKAVGTAIGLLAYAFYEGFQKIRGWWKDFSGWWNSDSSAVGQVRKAMKALWKPLTDGFSGAIKWIKQAWHGFTKIFDIKLPNPFSMFKGDGPGRGGGSNGGGWPGGSGGGDLGGAGVGTGSAGRMANSVLSQFGAHISSGYRTPASNAAAGGSPTSYHLDRANPAQDVVGRDLPGIFRALFNRYGDNVRELIYGTTMVKHGRVMPYTANDHWDHVHLAHEGGMVSPNWPTMLGLKSDERPAVLQVGERVIPRSLANKHGGGVSEQQLEQILERVLARGKAPVNIEQTFMERVDPIHMSAELAWKLR